MASKHLEMTDAEILQVLRARENLKKYGSLEAPSEGAAKEEQSDARYPETKKCPSCGETKDVKTEFGLVTRRGVQYAAGWCKECRNKTNYKNRPRVYNKK